MTISVVHLLVRCLLSCLTVLNLWGSNTGSGLGGLAGLGSSLSDLFALLPGRTLPAQQSTALARRQVSKDAELMVVRHENVVLRRQTGRVRYEPADRLWLAALSRLIPRRRWAEVFAVTPATLLAWHRRLVTRKWDYTNRRPSRTTVHGGCDPQARDPHGHRQPGLGHRRVQGELVKLGHPIAASTVWQILDDAGIYLAPRRTGPDLEQFRPPRPAASSRSISSTWTPCSCGAYTP